ncbi:hypothetical protein QA612_03730 [Evansella sp. AB-P1]|uniref:hypothetical protein n=1 Tax=Evansella sp. AB-P1 TaxID=3037653 RepID=UPI00241E13C4|nr:hypothetical protein [Evansella sp. AB-P1]MDG5786588.1 hypothetical protein [Evansella sp. AB-P1]
MQEQRKNPPFTQREIKRFAGTEEESTVPANREKAVCRNRGRIHRFRKQRKRGLQAQRKDPLFPQTVKKRFAGTEEGSTVPANREKAVCRNRGRIHCSRK